MSEFNIRQIKVKLTDIGFDDGFPKNTIRAPKRVGMNGVTTFPSWIFDAEITNDSERTLNWVRIEAATILYDPIFNNKHKHISNNYQYFRTKISVDFPLQAKESCKGRYKVIARYGKGEGFGRLTEHPGMKEYTVNTGLYKIYCELDNGEKHARGASAELDFSRYFTYTDYTDIRDTAYGIFKEFHNLEYLIPPEPEPRDINSKSFFRTLFKRREP